LFIPINLVPDSLKGLVLKPGFETFFELQTKFGRALPKMVELNALTIMELVIEKKGSRSLALVEE